MITLRQSVTIRQQLKLSQILSPKMIQMLKTFNFSYADLLEKANREVEDNVVLEVVRFDQLTDYATQRRAKPDQELKGRDVADFAKAASDKDQLSTFLMSQLELEGLSDKDHGMAMMLIEAIDDRGYIENYPEVRDEIKAKWGGDDRKVLSILRIIQAFEPDGVGARSLKECLLLQIESHQFDHERLRDIFREVISHHLDALADNQFEEIAAALDIQVDGVESIAEFIRSNLNPNPGSAYSTTSFNQQVIPSFSVEIENDQIFLTNLEETKGLQLGISSRYTTMLNDPALDEESRVYLKDRIKRAEEMIENIQRRHETMANLIQFILTHQVEFLRHGIMYLMPLLQKQVAEKMGISCSTVSRIVSSKYIETPHGILSLKQLCPRDHFGQTAKRLELIVMGIFHEYPTLSDIKIAGLLKARGIDIARRTVTKYRLISGMQSSFRRG